MMRASLDSLQWALSSALALLQMRQFSLVRGLFHWLHALAYSGEGQVFAADPNCALVSTILHRRKLPVSLASVDDFILSQSRQVPPEYVLDDHLSLYAISEREAVFVEVPHECNIYSGQRAPSPFLFDTQFELAVRVVRMPLETMLRLSNQVHIEPSDIVLLSNTTRCGSMLLCDMLEAVPAMRVLREPDALTCVLMLGNLSADAQRAVLRAVMRMLCKPSTRAPPAATASSRASANAASAVTDGTAGSAGPEAGGASSTATREGPGAEEHASLLLEAEGEPVRLRAEGEQARLRVAIKPRGHCIKLLKTIDAALPGCRHLFLYRDGLGTVQSMTRAYSSEAAQLTRYWLMQSAVVRQLCPVSAAIVKAVTVISDDPLLDWARSEEYFTGLPVFAKYALLWAIICQTYVQCREAGLPIAACKLEDLDSDRERFCREIFKWCGIPQQYASLAARACAQAGDAHGASIFSRARLARFGVTLVDSPALKRQLDEICDNCAVPRLGEPTLLPGTLGHP
jgi:hypothetical protein